MFFRSDEEMKQICREHAKREENKVKVVCPLDIDKNKEKMVLHINRGRKKEYIYDFVHRRNSFIFHKDQHMFEVLEVIKLSIPKDDEFEISRVLKAFESNSSKIIAEAIFKLHSVIVIDHLYNFFRVTEKIPIQIPAEPNPFGEYMMVSNHILKRNVLSL